MASITELKSGRFRVQLRRKALGYKEEYFDTRAEAERWATETEAGLLQKHHAASPAVERDLTFGGLLDKYFASTVFDEKAPSTQARERTSSVRLREEFGRLAVPVIDFYAVQDYFDKRSRENRRHSNGKSSEKRISGHTVRLEKAFLTAIYKFAKKRKLAPRNVMLEDEWDLPTCHEREGRITLEQQVALFRAARLAANDSKANPNLLPWLNFVFETGSRPGEAAKIELSWVNFKEETVAIPKAGQKKRNPRIVLLRDELIDVLKPQYAKAVAAGSKYLFWSTASEPRERRADGTPIRRLRTAEERANRPLVPYAYYHAWRGICAKAGVPPSVNPHIVRHEFISRLFESTNLNDSQIAALVGDVNVLSLAPYKHLRVGKLREQHVAHLSEIGGELSKLREMQYAMTCTALGCLPDGQDISALPAELQLTAKEMQATAFGLGQAAGDKVAIRRPAIAQRTALVELATEATTPSEEKPEE